MVNDTPTTKPAAGSEKEPDKPKDAQVEELEKQTARVVARQKLVEAQLSAVGSLGTGVTDGPTNTVTFGDKAGSLAPWLAQSVLADVATSISAKAWGAFYPEPQKGQQTEQEKPDRYVVFVTDDPELLATDVVSRQVQAAVKGRTREASAAVGNLTAALAELAVSVTKYQAEEAKREQRRRQPAGGGTRELLQKVLEEAAVTANFAADGAAAAQAAGAAAEAEAAPAEEAAPADAPAIPAGTGPIAAAVDLIRLLAVDYTVTAAEVTVDSALFARLSAGQLAKTSRGNDVVLLDGFALGNNSSTLRSYEAFIGALNKVADTVQVLGRAVASVTAEAEEYRLAVDKVQSAWTETTANRDAPEGAADELKDARDELTQRLTARTAAAAPTDELIKSCGELITAARAELAALATPDSTGISPLQRACSRDRLHDKTVDATPPVTHVLLVDATHAGADIVTRHSILGASGRVGYLGGANGAWVMVDTNGAVSGGGAVNGASCMTHDIASGETKKNPIKATAGKWKSTDPLEKNEQWIRVGVLLIYPPPSATARKLRTPYVHCANGESGPPGIFG